MLPVTREERVIACMDMMRSARWVRGKTAKVLAAEWGMAVNSVEDISSEAWRRLKTECANVDDIKPRIILAVDRALDAAEREGPVAVAKVADVYAKIVGANAPQKHEHQFGGKTDEELEAEAKRIAAAMMAEKQNE